MLYPIHSCVFMCKRLSQQIRLIAQKPEQPPNHSLKESCEKVPQNDIFDISPVDPPNPQS